MNYTHRKVNVLRFLYLLSVGVWLNVLFIEFDRFALFLDIFLKVVGLVGVHIFADLGEQVLVNTFL